MLFALVAISFTACGGSDAGKDNTVAATVNGKPIMLSEVEQFITEQSGGKQAQMIQLVLAEARLKALDALIQKEVLYQRAEKENLLPTEDEVSQYITAEKQKGGFTEEEFQKRLKEQNQTELSYREEAKKFLAIQKLENKYTASVSIKDGEVEEYYAANKEQYKIPRGVELADIVVDPQDNGLRDDAKTETDAKTKIDAIYQSLKTADFAEVARQKSEDASNARGGDIGFASEDQLKQNGFPQSLIDQLFGASMQIGGYTAPVQFSGRWYIFKLKRKQAEAENQTLETPGVRQDITEKLRGKHQELLTSALTAISMYDAKIVNNLASNMLASPNNNPLRPAPAQGSPATTATPVTATPLKTSSPAATATPKK
jgi:parvulin-like peptidyl-prolyl isomerase